MKLLRCLLTEPSCKYLLVDREGLLICEGQKENEWYPMLSADELDNIYRIVRAVTFEDRDSEPETPYVCWDREFDREVAVAFLRECIIVCLT